MRSKLAIGLLILAVAYFLLNQSGYSFSQEKALKQAASYSGQKQVYEKAFEGNKKVVLVSNGSQSKAQVVQRKWGFLYKPGDSVILAPLQGFDSIRYAWFSTGIVGDQTEVVFAAESFDDRVAKILISNDKLDAPNSSAEVKADATVYVELDVSGHDALAIEALNPDDIGSFVVRATDASGKILSGK